MRNVVIGLLGTKIDRTRGVGSWQPSIKLCGHDSLPVDRFELLHPGYAEALAHHVARGIAALSPDTEVRLTPLDFDNPWDLEEVYAKLYDFAQAYGFDEDRERYFVHLTTGTHVAQICWYLLTESRYVPARLIQMEPERPGTGPNGRLNVIDLDLAQYDAIQQRFDLASAQHSTLLRGGIGGTDPAIERLIDRLEQIALRSDAPILITGEAGSGRSTLGARVHELRLQRRQLRGKLVRVSGTALATPDGTAMLMGQKRGFGSAAAAERAGLLAQAHRGTLLIEGMEYVPPALRDSLVRAVECGQYRPVGGETDLDIQIRLLATARNGAGLETLFQWILRLPPLRERLTDLEMEFDHALDVAERRLGAKTGFAPGARARYLRFARSAEACWAGNFRDLTQSVLRLCTLADRGRITLPMIEDEIAELTERWRNCEADTTSPARPDDRALLAEILPDPAEIDVFDSVQLAAVVRVCRLSASLSDAGRALFAVSRTQRASRNDADRLRKYLARFGLDWDGVKSRGGPGLPV
ncbi:RNA repair transcriptional activator RtcR family protein [Asaia krungthepensis]|uniref:Sigma-54 dependent transcriptional regulator n=1 Tax=Asaia krungthepensis NRIC 0535 TaxID=1307925 RepID=A0ABQ0Q2B2_9PROT|nr:RNA repair transcriptional activator RtcR family protein [Asaia krungthepensis]GBQ87982.1 sigma-54 dependent transcriptional regulator [Asaia krungthepensis NRIC 0535]